MLAVKPPKPIPLKDRATMLFIEHAKLDVKDGSFVAVDAEGARTHIPIGGITCLMLEPGTRISHAAITLAARTGTLITWVGEGGVRLYSAGQPGGARSDKLLWQAKLALDDQARLKIVREMYRLRFDEEAPRRRSIEQLRGIEGARVRKSYELLAKQYNVKWKKRDYNPKNWNSSDIPNRCLSSATACLYGLSESAILAAGYAPAIGFLHKGNKRAFVCDIADIYKIKTVIPVAFKIAAKAQKGQLKDSVDRVVRIACRDCFRETKLLSKIILDIEKILKAGDLPVPQVAPEAAEAVLEDEIGIGDAGHRN